jgi:hypothetical protein
MHAADHWNDGLEGLPDSVRDQIVGDQIERAESPEVLEALASVHDAARVALRDEGNFGFFLLAAGATVLQGWQVSEGGEIYRRLSAYRSPQADQSDWAGRKVLFALRRFLLTQQVNVNSTH